MAQERMSSSSGSQREEDAPLPDAAPTPAPGGPSSAAQAQATQADDLLADIDAVLEANAEEFVKGFVQKGGQ